ncbi:uncharacterized protein LTR77_006342 [Saxophila tyrrhenica]|uniref:RRM domain-containing protein n=1 Tax=Saxophila tyrrhenica TaxID=1690608 RepID=A0AAV9P846_9PEZI|nr:hypothetical protein LTR77_006342 [Saxophila tyrrhenica]
MPTKRKSKKAFPTATELCQLATQLHNQQKQATNNTYPPQPAVDQYAYAGLPNPPIQQQQQPYPMDYTQYGNAQYANPQYNYQYPGQQAQPQQYQPTPPQIRNPFAPPPPARSQYNSNQQFDPVHEQELAQWASAYAPQDPNDKKNKDSKGGNANLTTLGSRPTAQDTTDSKTKTDGDKKKTVVRHGGGETWEDETLLEWDPSKFRIYVGNLAGEVTDDSLAKAFAVYDVNKARVVRDKRTTKSKGFGFVQFEDHELGFKAAREMVGKYVGSHPITIQKAKTDVNASVQKDNRKGKHGKGRDRGGNKKGEDVLRANTGSHIEKKPVMRNTGMKMLG